MSRKFQKRISSFSLLIMAVICFVCMNACKKDSQQTQTVTVSALIPDTGAYSTVVTINGSGFNTNVTEDIVKFNGVTATVQQATSTQLTVEVPKGAGTGTVTVQSGSLSATGPIFTYIYTATVTTLAGSGVAGFGDGAGTIAQFNDPVGLATDEHGNVYVADQANQRIRKIISTGFVSTFAGSGTEGFTEGSLSMAQFDAPVGVVMDAQGNAYVADFNNERIRKISSSGTVSTFAGNDTAGYKDGNGGAAQFNGPIAVGTDLSGNVYVAEAYNNLIRKITAAGIVSTLAGNGLPGFANGNGTAAQFQFPNALVTDSLGNVYVADGDNNCIRKISPAGVVSTFAGGGGDERPGFSDDIGTAALFNLPDGITMDPKGNIYVADENNNCIRMISPAGVVTTLAGSSKAGFADGMGNAALFNAPQGLAIDTQGNIYVSDGLNNKIRMITVQ